MSFEVNFLGLLKEPLKKPHKNRLVLTHLNPLVLKPNKERYPCMLLLCISCLGPPNAIGSMKTNGWVNFWGNRFGSR